MRFVHRDGWRGSLIASCLGLLALELIVVSCAGPEAVDDGHADGGDGATASDPSAGDAGGFEDSGAETSTDAQEPACGDAEWCPVKTNQPSWLGLTSVWGSGPNDVWIAGAAGSVNHWDGTQWRSATAPTSQTLSVIWGTGPNDIWAVSTADVVLHTTGFKDGEARWSLMTPIADLSVPTIGGFLRALWGTSPDDIWTAGDVWVMYRPTSFTPESGWRSLPADGGVVWTPFSSFRNAQVRSIWGSGPDDVWFVGQRPFAAHTNGVKGPDGLPKWTEFDTQSLAPLSAVWGSGPGDVWAVGDYGTIRHFTAGASRWAVVESPTMENLRGLWGAAANDIWAVGEHGTLLHYDGKSWRLSSGAFPPGKKPHLYSVWGSGPSDVWAVGGDTVLRLTR